MKSAAIHEFPRQHAVLSTADLLKIQLRVEAIAAADAVESAIKADPVFRDPTMRAISVTLVAVADVCAKTGNSTAEDFENGDTAAHNQQRALLCNAYCAVFYDVRTQHYGAVTPSVRFEEQAKANRDCVKEQGSVIRDLNSRLAAEQSRSKRLEAEVREHELRWREVEGDAAAVREPNFDAADDEVRA